MPTLADFKLTDAPVIYAFFWSRATQFLFDDENNTVRSAHLESSSRRLPWATGVGAQRPCDAATAGERNCHACVCVCVCVCVCFFFKKSPAPATAADKQAKLALVDAIHQTLTTIESNCTFFVVVFF